MPTINPLVLINLINKHIEPNIITDSLIINEWNSYTGIFEEPGKIVLDNNEPTVMRLGDRWKVGYDDTRFFEAKVIVPECMDNKKIYLSIDFGGEAIVRINGKIVGAVSSRENSGWVHRTEILFKDKAKAGEVLDIQIENAVNCAGFCDFAMAGATCIEYTLKEAKLYAVDEECESYWFDILTTLEAYKHTDDEYVKSRLFIAMDNSVHELDFDLGQDKFIKSVPAASKRLKVELGKIQYATPGKVIMAGHSHLDVAWLWTVKEIHRKTARTFANNLALMDIYPNFKFTQSQAVLFDYVKKDYPELYERVKEKVKNGQWEIVGNAWVEADTNLASGESLIRQLLYGREFFLKEFGVCSDTYWLPDCFGFTWALPQIIKRSGMDYFVTAKLTFNDTNEFPMSIFKWRAHSGDEVIAYLQKIGYQGGYDPEYIVNCRKNNSQNNIVDTTFGMFGYGDGGGGSTFQMVEMGARAADMPGLPKSTCGHVKDFFEEIEKYRDVLPVWDGEMYYENHRGTFTSQAFVKKNNRQLEYLMRQAEILCVLANDYPMEKLEEIWKLVLVNQFHDILPGTSIHEVYDNTREEYKLAHKMVAEVITNAFDMLNSKISAPENSVVVWNLLPWRISSVCEVTVDEKFSGISFGGKKLPCTVKNSDGKNILTFVAEDIAPMGYSIFSLEEKESVLPCVTAEKNLLENEFIRVELDENGLIDKIIDKENDRQILSGKGNLLTVSHDKPIHESAWNLEFDYKMKMCPLTEAESIEVIEASQVRGAVRIIRKYNKSTITQDVILEAGKKTVDFETKVDWYEREKVLKAEFPLEIRSRTATYEIAHGSTEYPTHYNTSYDLAKFECCAHKWADLSEGNYGASVINDCKYGYDIHDNVLRITLMRGPICPDPTGDIGVSEFRYSFYPHADSWREADTVKLAFAENVRPTAFVLDSDGKETENSFMEIDKDNIVIDAVKLAQDKSGIIVRVYEAETKRVNATLSTSIPFSKVIECNLMEVEEREIECADGKFSFRIKPNEVKTFKLI